MQISGNQASAAPDFTWVVDAYIAALGRGDLAAARGCLADEAFSFRGPIGEFNTADDFVNNVWGVIGILEGIDCRRRFVESNEVMDVLAFHTRFDEPEKTDIVQWSTIDIAASRISRIELFFDAHDYKSMFERRRS